MLNKICQLIRLGTCHCFRLSLSQITSEKTLKALKTWNVTDSSSSMEEEDEGNFILTFRLKVSEMRCVGGRNLPNLHWSTLTT